MRRQYIVRVELHNLPKGVDSRPFYDFLHSELLSRNFVKEVRGRNGSDYELPDAVYRGWENSPGTLNGADVSTIVQEAVADTVAFVKKSYPSTNMYGSNLVVEAVANESTTEVYWYNLTPA